MILMSYEQISEKAMELILCSGDSKTHSMNAIRMAKNYDFIKAEFEIKEANKAFSNAHEIQNELLTTESKNFENVLNILMVHAQDHLNTALILKDNAIEFIGIYRKFKELEERNEN